MKKIKFSPQLAGGIFCTFIILLIFFTQSMGNKIVEKKHIQLRTPIKEIKPAVQEPVEEVKTKKMRYEHQPSNPEDFGMIVHTAKNKPRSEEQWMVHIQHVVDEKSLFESEEGKEAARQMKISEEDYQKQMTDLERQIDLVKEEINRDPFNEDLETQLDNMYKLKALGTVLKDRVVIDSKNSLIPHQIDEEEINTSENFLATP